jgi:hypothetical protein
VIRYVHLGDEVAGGQGQHGGVLAAHALVGAVGAHHVGALQAVLDGHLALGALGVTEGLGVRNAWESKREEGVNSTTQHKFRYGFVSCI